MKLEKSLQFRMAARLSMTNRTRKFTYATTISNNNKTSLKMLRSAEVEGDCSSIQYLYSISILLVNCMKNSSTNVVKRIFRLLFSIVGSISYYFIAVFVAEASLLNIT